MVVLRLDPSTLSPFQSLFLNSQSLYPQIKSKWKISSSIFLAITWFSHLQPFRSWFCPLPFCLKQTVWSSRRRVQLRPEPDGSLSSGTLLERDRNRINSSGKNDGNTLLRALWSHRLWGRRDLGVSYALVHPPDQGDPVLPLPGWPGFQGIFAVYLTMTIIVLINLLIAMMSDTYCRIQEQVG